MYVTSHNVLEQPYREGAVCNTQIYHPKYKLLVTIYVFLPGTIIRPGAFFVTVEHLESNVRVQSSGRDMVKVVCLCCFTA